jgi:SAM-dependent methyltransferase
MSIYTSGEYQRKNPTWHAEDSAWKARQLRRVLTPAFFEKYFPERSVSLIDIGCGAGGVIGHFSAFLKQQDFVVEKSLGIDISESAIKSAREEWLNLHFEQQSINGVADHFDIGLLMDVLEHVEDYEDLLSQTAKRCRFFVLHIPLDDNWNNRLRAKFQELYAQVGHIHYFSPTTAHHMLTDHRLSVISEVYTPVFRDLPSGTFMNRLALWPRKLCFALSPRLTASMFGGVSLMVLVEKSS